MYHYFFIIFTLMAFFPLGLRAQSSFSFHPIISEGLQVSEQIEGQHPDVDILRMEFDVAEDDNYTYLKLERGVEYVFACFADNSVQDLSVILNSEYKNELTEITSASEFRNKATLRVSPEQTDTYVINIHVNKWSKGKTAGHYGLIVCSMNKDKSAKDLR